MGDLRVGSTSHLIRSGLADQPPWPGGTRDRVRQPCYREVTDLSMCRLDGIDVWSIRLDRPDDEVARLAGSLAPDERARAERFVFPRDRRRFRVARAALRAILASYLDLAPSALAFDYGPRGKPRLVGAAGLDFNLAHSHELALCAVTPGQPVGVDLEWLRPMADLLPLARTAFSAGEVAALLALPEAERLAAFFRGWTRKEAYIKARGDGLALPLDGFDVSLAPGQPPALLASRLDPAEPARWSFHHLEPAEGYLGALAVAGPADAPRLIEWREARPRPGATPSP
jgi:4'-phosphopantetheinyl transferase